MGYVEAGLAIFGLSVLLASSLALLTAALWARPGRAPRRPGYIKPPASSVRSRVGSYTTGATQTSAVYFSSPGEPGGASGALAIPPTPDGPNRPGALTWSGSATAALGANGQQRGAAA